MQEDIKILDIFSILKKHSTKILLSTLVCLGLSTVIIFFVATPTYISKAQLLVGQEERIDDLNENANPLERNVSMINTYTDIITGTAVLGEAEARLDQRYSIDQIRDAISIEHSQNSQAFSIVTRMATPEAAQDVLNAVTEAFSNRVTNIYGEDNSLLYAISDASFNPDKVSPDELFITLLGLMFGLSIGVLIAFGAELNDLNVTDEEFFDQLGYIQLGKIFEMSPEEAEVRKKVPKRLQKVDGN